jgi:hypothetical protein
MTRPRATSTAYLRRSFAQAVAGPVRSGAEDLFAGVRDCYPRAKRARLEDWLGTLEQRPGIEREALLFIALVCGTRFGIYLPRVEELQAGLWSWLTGDPRNMRPELADLLVSVLTPGLRKELRAREGWRLGPAGPRGKKVGAPPVARGAWATALLVDRYLRRNDVPARPAVEHAHDQAAILTARALTDPAELRRAPRRTGIPDPAKLLGALLEQYEWWLTHDAVHSKDPAPLKSEHHRHADWRRRHRRLHVVLARYGARTLAEETVGRIPTAIWGSGGPQDGVPKGLRGPASQTSATASLRRRPHAVPK